MGRLRDADELILPDVKRSLAKLDLAAVDDGAVKLALRYAALIDDLSGREDEPQLRGWALRWIGPLLLAALESLGATPAARARVKGGAPANAGAPTKLERLRAARDNEAAGA